jgi:hypothetical protein
MEVTRLFDTIYYQNEKFPQTISLTSLREGQMGTVQHQRYY